MKILLMFKMKTKLPSSGLFMVIKILQKKNLFGENPYLIGNLWEHSNLDSIKFLLENKATKSCSV